MVNTTAVPRVLTAHHKQGYKYATILAITVTLGPFFYGFEGMVLNGAIKAVGHEFRLGELAQGVTGAMGIIGGIVGAFIAGRVSDHIGRKTTLLWVGPFLAFEAIFGAFSPVLGGFFFLLFCRFIGGMGFGAATTVAPGYVSEIAPAAIRGRLVAFRQLAIILGLFFAGIANLTMSRIAGDSTAILAFGLEAWQWMFMCLIIPAALYIVGVMVIPESPRYLVSVNKVEESKAILFKLGTPEAELDDRIARIRRSIGEGTTVLSVRQVLCSQWRRLVWVGVAIAAFQQLTGVNGVFFFSNKLFEAVGFSESTAFLQTLLLTLFKIVGVTTGIFLVDRVGRKTMLVYGGTLIFIALAIEAFVFTVAPTAKDGSPDVSSNKLLGFVAIAALCLFILGFTSSWGPIFSILMGEMFPQQIRGTAMSLVSGSDFVVNFCVVLIFPFFIAVSPALTYWIYSGFGVLAVIFITRFLQETKGRDLEDMGT